MFCYLFILFFWHRESAAVQSEVCYLKRRSCGWLFDSRPNAVGHMGTLEALSSSSLSLIVLPENHLGISEAPGIRTVLVYITSPQLKVCRGGCDRHPHPDIRRSHHTCVSSGIGCIQGQVQKS